jgi:hypothetical protein
MTARERTLALGLVSILLAGGTFLGALKLKAWKQSVDDAEYDLTLLRTEAEILMAQKDLWLKRADWIGSKQPEFKTRRDSDTELNKIVQDSMANRSVEVVQNQPSDPTELPGLFASTMMVQGRAEFTAAMSWLYDLQQPGSFISIPSIAITPNDEDTAQVNISLVLQKWYRKTDS